MTRDPRDREWDALLAAPAYDLLNAVAAIRARAQQTRRRVGRVDRLSREHIAADLEQIERQVDRLIGLIAPALDDPRTDVDGRGTGDAPPSPSRHSATG